jgi:hypothetical protein
MPNQIFLNLIHQNFTQILDLLKTSFIFVKEKFINLVFIKLILKFCKENFFIILLWGL